MKIPEHINLEDLKAILKAANIHVSFRGQFMRLSCYVYNTKAHFEALANLIVSKYG